MPQPSDPQGMTEPLVGQFLAGASIGGAEIYSAMLASERAAQGLPASVIVFDGKGPLSERFAKDLDVSYLKYRRSTIRNPIRFFSSVFQGYRKLEKAIATEGIDVLQTHLPNTHFWGLVLTLRKRCRVVFTIHNNNFMPLKGGTRFGAWVKHQAFRWILKHGAVIVPISDEVKRSLLGKLKLREEDCRPIRVVTNGVLIPESMSPERKAAVRERHGVAANDFWILAAGRLTEAKNFQCLIAAAKQLQERGINPKILIGGEGHLRNDLERQVAELGLQDSIDLPGNLSDLGDVMQAADLLVMPSRWEGLPLVLLEAMARSLPVVGTRINGFLDVVTEGEHGLLVDVDDSEGLADAVSSMIADDDRRLAMGAHGLDLVRRKYDFARVYDQSAEIYRLAMK